MKPMKIMRYGGTYHPRPTRPENHIGKKVIAVIAVQLLEGAGLIALLMGMVH